MDQGVVVLVLQGLQYLYRKPPYKILRHTHKIIVLNEVVQIDREQLEGDDEVLAEQDEVLDADDVVLVVLVVLIQIQQYLKLHARLILKLLLIPNNLNRHNRAIRMI